MTDADNLIRQLDEKDAEIGRLESLLDRARPLARKNLEQAAEIEELKAEIAALQQNDANREALLDSLLRLRNEHILEIAALREAALNLIEEINKHPISSTISSTSIHYFKRTLSDRCPARQKEKP